MKKLKQAHGKRHIGETDAQMIRDLLEKNGISSSALKPKQQAMLLEHLHQILSAQGLHSFQFGRKGRFEEAKELRPVG